MAATLDHNFTPEQRAEYDSLKWRGRDLYDTLRWHDKCGHNEAFGRAKHAHGVKG